MRHAHTVSFCARTVCLIVAISFLAVPTAHAAYLITVDQVGPDVVATGSGSINVGGTPLSNLTSDSAVIPNQGGILVGPTNVAAINTTFYQTVSGPSSFGSGAFTAADSGSGAPVGIIGATGALIVPLNYLGGDLGTSTDTWSNQTVASLGLNPGTYTYTFPSDSVTVQILPEPGTLGLLAGAGLICLSRRRTRKHQ